MPHTPFNHARGFMECKSIQISVRKTTAAGTGTLRGRVIWEKAS